MNPTYSGPMNLPSASNICSEVETDQNSADVAVDHEVRALLAASPFSKTAYIAVTVRNGIVTLDGTVSDGLWLARFKNQVTSAIPSVTIDDRLEWVVPDCGIGVV